MHTGKSYNSLIISQVEWEGSNIFVYHFFNKFLIPVKEKLVDFDMSAVIATFREVSFRNVDQCFVNLTIELVNGNRWYGILTLHRQPFRYTMKSSYFLYLLVFSVATVFELHLRDYKQTRGGTKVGHSILMS